VTKALLTATIAAALLSGAVASAAPGRHARRAAHGRVSGAGTAPPLTWGVADDAPKFADDGGEWFDGMMGEAGLSENRWTLAFDPSRPTEIVELPFLEHAAPVAQDAGIRVVLALYSGDPAPLARVHPAGAFCAWAGLVAQTAAQWGIHDFIVGNEPNTALYWAPQKNRRGKDVAAAPYERLLARCYDVIHTADPEANVIGMGLSPRASRLKTSNEPLAFLRDVGAVYRKSSRSRHRPLMDQLALHPYPNPSVKGSPPSAGYSRRDDYGLSQLDRVKQAVYDAFHGTAQRTTLNGLTFRIDEVGWQTDTSAYPQYVGVESWKQVVSEQQQARYLATTARKYVACDPTVTDVELFLLVDELYRSGRDELGQIVGGGWQSGLLTVGGAGLSQPKLAFTTVAPLFAAGRAACRGRLEAWRPARPARRTPRTGLNKHSSSADR
jgi:hypothetical protein